MKKRIFFLVLVIMLLGSVWAFAAQAETDEVTRYNGISAQLENAPLDFSDGNVPVCPWCGTTPESWQALGACTGTFNMTGNAHYYLTEDLLSNTHYYNINKNANICIYLNGKDILSSKRAFYVASGGTMNIMGTKESTVSGTAADESSERGIALDSYGGTINVCGGTYTQNAERNVVLLRGAGSVLNIYAGTLIQGVADYKTPAVNVSAKNCVLNMYGGEITGGKSSGNGGNVYASGEGIQIHLKGGKVTNGTANSGGNIAASSGAAVTVSGNAEISGGRASGSYSRGGNIYIGSNSTLTVNGGRITGGYSDAPEVKRGGGNICLYKGTMTMTGGTVENGTSALYGGNLFMSEGAVASISGGTVSGGIGTGGGNICVGVFSTTTGDDYKTTLNLTGGTVTGGIANGDETGGGNILVIGNSENTETLPVLDLSGGTVSDGGATVYGGGNLYLSRCEFTMTDGTVSGGTAKQNGGNLFISGAVTKANISGGTVTGGYSEVRGGNVYVASLSVILNLTGGSITNGVARSDGGNIYANNGRISLTGGSITGGCSDRYGGNVLIGSGGTNDKVTLGNCRISGGTALGGGNDIYMSSDGKLLVKADFACTASLYVHSSHLTEGNRLNTTHYSTEGPFSGQLLLENLDNNPLLYAKEGDSTLYIATVALVKDNKVSWYRDNRAALAAYADGDILCPAAGELVLDGGDYTVDIAGNAVAITGAGTVILFDSANDTFEVYGSATVNGPELKNAKLQTVGQKQYYMLEENGSYTFHRVEIELITSSMRPSIAGIYYTGRWSCDEVMAKLVGNFGVAASLVEMPGDDFASLEKPTSKWSVFKATEFESGVTKTGVMISGILKSLDDNVDQSRVDKNSEYAQKKVYAKAYLNIEGVNYTGGGLSYSLYDILKYVSDHIEEYSANAKTLQSFMAKWSANGLTGEPWDSLSFQVDAAIENLNALYADKKAYYGELHDHASTGGTSDGKQTLEVWKSELERLNMDFATIVDHRQSSHMYLDAWDNSIFIGGSEAATTISDRTGVKTDYNMIFADPAGLEAVLAAFPEFKWQYYPEDYTGSNAEKLAGGWHYSYPKFTGERFAELCEAILAEGGFVIIPHPKSDGYITSTDPADAWFVDGIAVEVFYTYRSTRKGWKTLENYKLWKSMIDAGYKVYASAGNDEHDMPSDKAVSVIHATEKDAGAYVESLRNGNFVAGGVDVRTAIGDTTMGGTTSFAGKRMGVSVNGFHTSVYKADHIYRVDVITDKGVAYSQEISCTENFYYAFDVDADAMYYYVEIHDVTDQSMLAIGNPIWNADK